MANDPAQARLHLKQAKRIVIKIGTHSLVDEQGHIHIRQINRLVKQIANLQQLRQKEIIIVSSGAIGAGTPLLGRKQRPRSLMDCQLAAAVGQTQLLHQYQRAFNKYKLQVSQILVTHDDLNDRTRHLNARNTLLNSLRYGIIPIVNENDAISVDEIKIGDNDTLSALISTLVDADLLILLTTCDGLLEFRSAKRSTRIAYVPQITEQYYRLVKRKKNTDLSTGGMKTKLDAAQIANHHQIRVVIANSHQLHILETIINGGDVGTLFDVNQSQKRLQKRKAWISFFHKTEGILQLDPGACAALKNNKSLLPSGIVNITGQFKAGALIALHDANHQLIGQGLSEFSHREIDIIKGQQSHMINTLLGEQSPRVVIHRDNLVIHKGS